MPEQKIYLVGAGIEGWEGFGKQALEVIDGAEVLIGHKRLLDIFPNFKGEKRLLEDLSIMLEFGMAAGAGPASGSAAPG